MSTSPKSVDTSRLDTRVNSAYDYTNADTVVDTLSNIITCLILQETSSEMIILNEQCYDSHAFDQYVKSETKQTEQFVASGYNRGLCQFKDPQTGEDFPFDFALSNMVHKGISLIDLKDIIISRISGLTLSECTLYVSHDDDQYLSINVNAFVSHITNLRVNRSTV